jgi:hypothetical protein
MKTAISIPDDVFQAAEEPCKRLGMSRSEFYAKPMVAFVKSHKSTRGKESLDAIYAPEDSYLAPALTVRQVLSLPEAEWQCAAVRSGTLRKVEDGLRLVLHLCKRGRRQSPMLTAQDGRRSPVSWHDQCAAGQSAYC